MSFLNIFAIDIMQPTHKKYLNTSIKRKIEGFINSGSFNNITYIAELQLKKNGMGKMERIATLRLILNETLDHLSIVSQDNDDFLEGINNAEFSDLEDSYQYQAFNKANCDYLVTINTQDFPCNTDKRIIHLTDFVRDFLTE